MLHGWIAVWAATCRRLIQRPRRSTATRSDSPTAHCAASAPWVPRFSKRHGPRALQAAHAAVARGAGAAGAQRLGLSTGAICQRAISSSRTLFRRASMRLAATRATLPSFIRSRSVSVGSAAWLKQHRVP